VLLEAIINMTIKLGKIGGDAPKSYQK